MGYPEYELFRMPRLTASPATLGVPKEQQTLPSLFPWRTDTIFQFDRNHQTAALEGGDGRCNYCTGNQDLPGLLCEQSQLQWVFCQHSSPHSYRRAQKETGGNEIRFALNIVQYSTCTRLIVHTKIKITVTVCLIALKPIIGKTFPGPVFLETIWAPLIIMEANLCVHTNHLTPNLKMLSEVIFSRNEICLFESQESSSF